MKFKNTNIYPSCLLTLLVFWGSLLLACQQNDNITSNIKQSDIKQQQPQKNTVNQIDTSSRTDNTLETPTSTPSIEGEYKMNVVCKTDSTIRIERVKILEDKTIIDFIFTNETSSSRPITTPPPGHKEAFFIMDVSNSKKYNLLDVDGIDIKPKYTIVNAKKTQRFTLTFERIDNSMKRFHVIEGEIEPNDGNTSWRFLNVELKK